MLRSIGLLVLITLITGVLLTPFACEIILFFTETLPWPFSRIFDRVLILGVLIALYVLRKDFTFSDFKSKEKNKIKKYFFYGLILSIFSSLIFLPYLFYTKVIIVNTFSFSYFCKRALKILMTATVVSLIEESFFRGVLFEKLRTKMTVFTASLVVSLVFAVVHFIAPNKIFTYISFSPLSGFHYVFSIFNGLFNPDFLIPFLGLFLLGMTLCYAKIKTNSLSICMGLHFGWIIIQRSVNLFCHVSENFKPDLAVINRIFLLSQPISLIAISLVLIIFVLPVKKNVIRV